MICKLSGVVVTIDLTLSMPCRYLIKQKTMYKVLIPVLIKTPI